MAKRKSESMGSDVAGTKMAEKPVVLMELDERQIRVRIRGTTSLIVHAWSAKAVKMMEDAQQKKAKKAKEAKDPVIECESCQYRDADGKSCFPASAFKKAMISAATSIEDKRFPKTKIRQSIFVEGHLLPILGPEPSMRTDPVRLRAGGSADIRYRPEFPAGWTMDLTLTYNAAVVSAEQVVNLLNLAGFAVGIGDWRPEKDGNNGRFRVESSPK